MDAIPYCGTPPAPGEVAWNLDPLLGGALVVALLLALRYAADRRALVAAWLVLAALLVSPLCNLSVALFSARAGQHLAILLVAAPLLAMGLRLRMGSPLLAAAVFAVALWAWHLPAPYAATFRSDAVYWVMQGTLLGSAVWLWRGLLLARAEIAFAAGLATAVQMGALGALLTFAPRPIFAPHALSTLPWGLTPLEDQQLGGLLMWVPGGTVFAVAAVLGLVLALRRRGFAA